MSIFKHKQKPSKPEPLHVNGVKPATITAAPDDREIAAQALLELMTDKHPTKPQADNKPQASVHDRRYYDRLADRIGKAHVASRRRTQRFVTFCEYQLQKHDLPVTGDGSLQLLEVELYKRIDIVEREGGDLKTRWQHCLAEVTVRLMTATDNHKEKG